jgi:hypothetical protein
MPPQPELEIILKAVSYNDFAPLALGIGNSMASVYLWLILFSIAWLMRSHP